MALPSVYTICIALVFFQLIPAILSWGDAGHYAICKIAQDYLTESAKDAMKELLPGSAEGQLAAVCSRPDLPEIREGYPWTDELHYAYTPDFQCTFGYSRDCHNAANETDRCVVGATYNYTLQLELAYKYHKAEAFTNYNLTEALMFLAHFVGDVHQPLNLGYLGDLGGNRVIVSWFNITTSLHHVWDDAIIDTALERYYGSNLTNLIEAIKSNMTDDWLSELKSSEAYHSSDSPRDFAAAESISLACEYAYKNARNGTQLDDDYFLSRLPIVEKRLAQGGKRLADILEKLFGAKTNNQNQVISAV